MDGLLIVSGVLLFWVVFACDRSFVTILAPDQRCRYRDCNRLWLCLSDVVSDLCNRISGMLSGNSRCGRRNPDKIRGLEAEPRFRQRAVTLMSWGFGKITNQLRRSDHQIKALVRKILLRQPHSEVPLQLRT